MKWKTLFLVILSVTVLSPIFLYTDRLTAYTNSLANNDFVEDFAALSTAGETFRLNALSQEPPNIVKEPAGVVILHPLDNVINDSYRSEEISEEIPKSESKNVHKNRVLSATDEESVSDTSEEQNEVVLEQVTEKSAAEEDEAEEQNDEPGENQIEQNPDLVLPREQEPRKVPNKNRRSPSDAKVRRLRDQLIRARIFLNMGQTRSSPHYIRDLKLRIREVHRALGEASKDSDLPRNVDDKIKAMEETLARGQQIQDSCSAVVKKLRAILHSTEEQLRVNKKQTIFLTQLAAKTLPKGLHCLPLRLSNEYFSLSPNKQQFPNQHNLENPDLYHYALFSDNVLAASVVVNSTISNAKEPAKHVFHVVTDKLNYAAMRMWFLANLPGKATIQVQNIDEFTWLNSSYSPAIKQLQSQSMIDYYFRTHKANSDSNLKYRNPKYLSILNHLRFYLPQVFPKLNKILFLDDDVVVQKDLTPLWKVKLNGKVNGAVETCGQSFHRFDRYLNFSHPLIAKSFDPRACGWAYGMNVFDLAQWKKQKITENYHFWQKQNSDRLLWKLGTLPPGLITFWNQTFALDRSWHVLGLGYNTGVAQKDIERAAVIHYNGNLKPWLEIAIPKFRSYWSKFVDFDHPYLHDCNINP